MKFFNFIKIIYEELKISLNLENDFKYNHIKYFTNDFNNIFTWSIYLTPPAITKAPHPKLPKWWKWFKENF